MKKEIVQKIVAWRSREGKLLCERCAFDPERLEPLTRRWDAGDEECFMCELCLKVYNRHVDREKMKKVYYNYGDQCWYINGIAQRCGHSEDVDCTCYGKIHEGEMDPIY